MDSALALISQSSVRQNLPSFKVGQTVRIHQKIKEGDKERLQVYEGLIIRVSNPNTVSATITVRKIVDGVGVERVFPVHSPVIVKVELSKEARVRRGKLYFMRDLSGKSARLRTTLLEGQVFETRGTEAEEPAKADEAPTVEAEVKAEPAPSVEAEVKE